MDEPEGERGGEGGKGGVSGFRPVRFCYLSNCLSFFLSFDYTALISSFAS